MAKQRGIEAKLSRLRVLRDETISPETTAELRKLLADASNLVAAESAEIIGNRVVPELASDLVLAFERFMVEPEATDKLCRAKIAIVEALNKIEYEQEDVFLRGIHHFQIESGWPKSQDSAAPLRGGSAFGLVRVKYSDVLILLSDLLADPEKVARVCAAQALGETGARAAIPLLRFKARAGDTDATVTAECLSALVKIAAKESLPFVTKFLQSGSEPIADGAAFALAESRLPEALQILKEFWTKKRERGSMQETILLAIAMLRLPAALDFLVEIVAADNSAAAVAALSALAIHRHNASLRDRIAAAVAKKSDTALLARFRQKFEVKE